MPSPLQRSQGYFAYTYMYLGWSWCAVQSIGPIAQNSAKWQPLLIKKSHFLQIYFGDYNKRTLLGVRCRMCAQIFVPVLVPSLLEIYTMMGCPIIIWLVRMTDPIFRECLPWVFLVCSAKYRPNCSRSRKMAVIFNFKKHHNFALFSNLFWLFKRDLIGSGIA